MLTQQRGGPEQCCCMHVMSAGVHGSGDLRRIRPFGAFFNGESVYVGAEQNCGVMLLSSQYGSDACGQTEVQLLQPERKERCADLRGCLLLLLGKLRMLMKLAAKIKQSLHL